MDKENIENLEGEIWIENNGYKISNKGRIIGKKGYLLNCKENYCGYLQCSVTFEDGFHAGNVHRAVAYAFLGKPKEGQEINHKDGNKQNNCVENLEWVTKKENQQHEAIMLQNRGGENCYMGKLTEEVVLEIYDMCKNGNMMYKDIAKLYDVDPSFVSQLCTGRVWRYLNLPILRHGNNKNLKQGESKLDKLKNKLDSLNKSLECLNNYIDKLNLEDIDKNEKREYKNIIKKVSKLNNIMNI